MKRQIGFAVLFVVLLLFCYTVWPTPYWYHTIPGGNFIRVSRFSGKIWHIKNGHWYNQEELDEIVANEADEIKKRCKDVPYPHDSNGVRYIELKGYSVTCP
jgi:Zn-finger protein